jgi:multiple sugar transport system permease protein
MLGRARTLGQKIFLSILGLVVVAWLLLPLSALVFGAFQTEASLLADVMNIIPKEWTTINFEVLLGKETPMYVPPMAEWFPRAFWNSSFIAISVTFFTLAFATLTAYSVARLKFVGSGIYAYILLASRMVPIVVLLVPLYITLRKLHLLNSIWGVIITEVGFLLPFSIWMLMGYFASLPIELEDAARIDGCTRLGSLVKIVLPLSAPGLAAAAVITFMISWHELVIPLIIAPKQETMTIPVLLANLVTDYRILYTLMNAISLIGLIPTALLAILLRRYVVRGLIAGAIKG